MRFLSFKVAPGVRVKLSSRGVRTSIGPRSARVHVGAGRPGVSTGAGPLTLYQSIGPPRRRSGGSRGSSTSSLRNQEATLRRQQKLNDASALNAELIALQRMHLAEFVPAQPPIAPPPAQVDADAIRAGCEEEALSGIGVMHHQRRVQAKAQAAEAAKVAIAAQESAAQNERNLVQEDLDRQWSALVANDPDTVMLTAQAAFSDNDAPAAVIDVDGDHLSMLVAVRPIDFIPERHGVRTEAGNVSIRPLSAKARPGLLLLLHRQLTLGKRQRSLCSAPEHHDN